MARCFHLAPSAVGDHLNLDSQVRLIAAQLVALVEKVGDKDKVKATSFHPPCSLSHISTQVQRFKKNIKPQILEMIEDIGKHPAAVAH